MARAIWSTKMMNVMSIDIDSVLFVSPEEIFKTRQYKETGYLRFFYKYIGCNLFIKFIFEFQI